MSFLTPTLKDIIDILIISIFIYYILLLLSKKAGGILILVGVFFLISVYLISTIVELSMVSSIFNTIRDYWLLIFIIIFQSEIKTAIIKLGRHENLSFLFKTKSKVYYHTLINAINVLAFRKTGALIVLEGDTKLNQYISSGEVIDSMISTKLILTIFNTNTILHDGAAIIRDKKIYAVKVVLPLSSNVEYVQQLGTRHLAAVGITESTDAAVIVVSEETGNISFAYNGVLHQGLSIEELRQRVADVTKV